MRLRVGELLAVVGGLACAAVIGIVQPHLDLHKLKIKLDADTTSLPPPQDLKLMSLGYNAAVSDILWASLLVEHGIHSKEHRGFHGVDRYIDGITTLDPQHPSVYRFADTLLVLAKPGGDPTAEDVQATRIVFDRGLQALPYDSDLWLHYGQFLAFLAPGIFNDPAMKDALRREGALKIAHAVELGADADRSLAASTILNGTGETKAAIAQLQRAYAITDNPETRRQILLKLQRLKATPEAEETVAKVEYDWRTHFAFLTRGGALLIGPSRSTAACAGPASYESPGCASDWSGATGNAR